MTDRRELILDRLFVILKGLPGMKSAQRNRGELPADLRPAVVLLDGDERARPGVAQARGRLTMSPNIVDLSPEIYVVMDAREPKNERIGEDMNAMRVTILKAIKNDAELASILGGNGDIAYNGSETDMASGRSMEGQLHVRMTFTYPLKPSEL